MRLSAAMLALTVLAAGPAQAFDCSLARTETEKAICASPALTDADRALNAAYRTALAGRTEAQQTEIRQAQRAWLREIGAACHGDAACLGARYRDRIAALSAAPAATGGAQHYSMVRDAKTAPYELDLNYPRFEGASAAALNAWVKDALPDCGDGGDDVKGSSVSGKLTVKALNDAVAVIGQSEEVSCSYAAHPTELHEDAFLSLPSATPVDLYSDLPDQAKKTILQKLKAQNTRLPATDDCKDAFQEDTTIIAGLDTAGAITFHPEFPHVAQVCDDKFQTKIPLDDLKALYPAGSASLAIVKALAK